MSNRTAKWILGIITFLVMWIVWGFNEEANIINNIGWFFMVAGVIAWTESVEARREAKEFREWAQKHIGEIHTHNVPKDEHGST